jgi:hypothetical protein
MPIDDVTGKFLKHYAQDEVSKERYVVIALQNDTNPDTCSVVAYDLLDADMRSELINTVNSDECQHVPEIWKVLDKKFFYSYPKSTMLQVLRALRQIRVVDEKRVKVELPGDITMTPKEIVNAINEYEEKKTAKVGSKFHATDDTVKAPIQTDTVVSNDDTKIKEMESRMLSMEDKINSISSSISDLVSALKASTVSKSED